VKILLIHDYPELTGGAEGQLATFQRVLRRRGHDARLFASTARSGGSPADVTYSCFGTTSRFRTLLQTANVSAFSRLRKAVREFKPDVAHVKMFLTQLSPLILPALQTVPTVYYASWLRPICPTGIKKLPNGMACSSVAGKACLTNGCLPLFDWVPLMAQMALWKHLRNDVEIVSNSNATRSRLVADGLKSEHVIMPGVSQKPAPATLSERPTITAAARLVPEKGIDVLLDAFAILGRAMPEAQLLVAGDGPERESLAARAQRLGLASTVRFCGWLPHTEMDRAFAGAWVQVVPSVCEEGCGNAAIEGMMRGTAVVASAIGGLREVVQHESSGLLVPHGDPAALAESLRRILTDRSLAERYGAAAQTYARAHFSDDANADAFLALYERLIAARLTPRLAATSERGRETANSSWR
jgi:glycosyltransferase involved in cell wall biosynthesis